MTAKATGVQQSVGIKDPEEAPSTHAAGIGSVPVRHYGPTDWERYDRLEAIVEEVLVAMEFALGSTARRTLVRSLFDDGCDADASEGTRLVRMLAALSEGVAVVEQFPEGEGD